MSGLSTYLRSVIDMRDWSLTQAAEMAGMQASTLSMLLNDPERIPELATLEKIARGWDIPLGTLIEQMGYTVDRSPTPEARAARIAALLDITPWAADLLEQLIQLPPARIDQYLTMMTLLVEQERQDQKLRRARKAQKGRKA